MSLIKESYKELAAIPELLRQNKYEEAINYTVMSMTSGFKYDLLMYVRGLVSLYRMLFDKTLSVDARREEYHYGYFLMNKEIMKKVYLTHYEDLFTEQLMECVHSPDNFISWYFKEYAQRNENIAKGKILSMIYSTLARIIDNNKAIELNIFEANRAIDIDQTNYNAYAALAEIYESKKDVEKAINILIKWASVDNKSTIPCMLLVPHYFKKHQYKEAGISYLLASKRAQYSTVNNNDKILYKAFAHETFARAFWKEEDYVRAEKHLIKAYSLLEFIKGSRSIDDMGKPTTIAEVAESDCYLYSYLAKAMLIDKKIKELSELSCRSFAELYVHVVSLECFIQNTYNIKYYKTVKSYFCGKQDPFFLMVIIAKRVYLALLYSIIIQISKRKWNPNKYIRNIYEQILSVSSDELLSEYNISKDYPGKIDKYAIGDKRIYLDMCKLIRNIFNKYDFTAAVKSVDTLEKSIKEILKGQTPEGTKNREVLLVRSILMALPEIDGKLSIGYSDINKIFNQLSGITSQVAAMDAKLKEVPDKTVRALMISQKGNITASKYREVMTSKNKNIIITNKGPVKIKDIDRLTKKRDEGVIDFWVNCNSEELWVHGKEINKISQPQLSIISTLLLNIGNPVNYDELIKCLPGGNNRNDVQKMMGRIKNKIGIRIYKNHFKIIKKIGYMIKGNSSYCLINVNTTI